MNPDGKKNVPFGISMPSVFLHHPLALTGTAGYNIPIDAIPSRKGELWEYPQVTKSIPPQPVYAPNVIYSSAENPLSVVSTQQVALSPEDREYFRNVLSRPDSHFVDRISAKEALRNDESQVSVTTKTVPVAVFENTLDAIASASKTPIISSAQFEDIRKPVTSPFVPNEIQTRTTTTTTSEAFGSDMPLTPLSPFRGDFLSELRARQEQPLKPTPFSRPAEQSSSKAFKEEFEKGKKALKKVQSSSKKFNLTKQSSSTPREKPETIEEKARRRMSGSQK